MWRSLFIALGIFSIVLGLECLVVDQVEWRPKTSPARSPNGTLAAAPRGELSSPPDWAPWSFLSGGAVTILYAVSLPKRLGLGG